MLLLRSVNVYTHVNKHIYLYIHIYIYNYIDAKNKIAVLAAQREM